MANSILISVSSPAPLSLLPRHIAMPVPGHFFRTFGTCSTRICRPLAPLKCRPPNIAVETEAEELSRAKFALLNAVQGIDRGLKSSPEQRSSIEEAMVAIESFDAGSPLDLKKLDGTWLLQYTTALDVLSILQATEFPFFKVGQILQKFECSDSFDGGLLRNVVRWSLTGLLQEDDGATLTVTAKFSVVTARHISLQFQEAVLGGFLISEQLQAVLAPAILPRTYLNLQILQFLRTLNARIPLHSGNADATRRVPPGLLYYLSFLDDDMLLGRSLGGGGIFIFSRTQPLQIF